MPYKSNAELPKGVKGNLPEHAQGIWRSAFNASFGEQGEERAFKIAWSAVKNAGYIKKAGKWMRKTTQLSAILEIRKKRLETLATIVEKEKNTKRKIVSDKKEAINLQKSEIDKKITRGVLQQLLNTTKNTNVNKELEQLNISFKINEELSSSDGDLYISGVALAEGTYHGKYYPDEILPDIAKQLVGKPLRMAHQKGPKNIVGKITTTKYDSGSKEVRFKAKVFDAFARKLIEEELYEDVSIGVWIDKFNDIIHGWTAANPEVDELSILEKGECPLAKIKTKEYLN